MSTAAVDTDHLPLPGVLAEVEAVAGRDAALLLAGEKGGTEVYLPSPQSLADDHWLVVMLGRAAAERVCSHFRTHSPRDHQGKGRDFTQHKGGGVRVEVPTARALMRRLQVRWMTLAGVPTTQIASQLRMTTRGVGKIRASLRATGEIE